MPGTSTEQVVDKGIRQKSIHSFHSIHSFPDGSAFCPGAPKRVPSESEKHRRVYTSSNVCHSHEWRVDTASGKTRKKRNACLHAVRQAVEKKLHVYTASEAKGLKGTREGPALIGNVGKQNCFYEYSNCFIESRHLTPSLREYKRFCCPT